MFFYNKRIFKRIFHYNKRYWYKNLKQIPVYFKDMRYLITHGYDKYAVYDVYDWFIDIMRDVLTEFQMCRTSSEKLNSNEIEEVTTEDNDTLCDERLNHMIFLLEEMDEDTCSKKNPYEDEWIKIYKEFDEKYGILGKGLETDKEKEKRLKTGETTMHFPDELTEYKDIMKNYSKAENELFEYRRQCKNEFLGLFSNHFFDLWD